MTATPARPVKASLRSTRMTNSPNLIRPATSGQFPVAPAPSPDWALPLGIVLAAVRNQNSTGRKYFRREIALVIRWARLIIRCANVRPGESAYSPGKNPVNLQTHPELKIVVRDYWWGRLGFRLGLLGC